MSARPRVTGVRAAAKGPRGHRAAAAARAPGTTPWTSGFLGFRDDFQLKSRGKDNALEFYSDEFLWVTQYRTSTYKRVITKHLKRGV